MSKHLHRIVEESIKLELNMSRLYEFFSTAFPKDSDFWNKLSVEEKNHANLIETGKKLLLSCGEFPAELLSPSAQDIIKINDKLICLLEDYNKKMPSRETTFTIAISLEESAGEIHFQDVMDNPPASEYIKIFQELNNDDKNHAKRIREYMNSFGSGS